MSNILSNVGSDMFDQMKTDAMRTLYDVFPDKTVK